MKIKCNVALIKWLITIFFLLGNLLFITYEKEDMISGICLGIIINFLAIFSFVMLSIFPRCYYIFDEEGCSLQNRKGKAYYHISWEDVTRMFYGYWLLLPQGLVIDFKDHCVKKEFVLMLSNKQVELICNTFPKVKEIMDKKLHS